MAAQTQSAHMVARNASKVAGRTVTDKQVRGVARSILARFDKTKHPAYQSHDYSADEARRIVAVFAARAKGRAPSAPKRTAPKRAPRKAPTTAQTDGA